MLEYSLISTQNDDYGENTNDMSFLKGLGTFICSFLLFLALGIFSMAFMLHSTVLSANFVHKEVNQISISSIARDVADKQIADELPTAAEPVKNAALDVIAMQEPWIKAQLNSAIDIGYNYFLGKTDTLYIDIPLADIKASLGTDLWNALQNNLKEELAGKSESEISQYLQDFIGQIPTDILPLELAVLPWNLRNIAIEEYLRQVTGQKTLVGVPPGLTAQVTSQVKVYFDDYFTQFTKDIADHEIIDANKIGPEGMKNIKLARRIIDDFQTAFPWLIVFMIAMAGLIFLINLDARKTARTLGINILIFGVLDLAGSIIGRMITPSHFIHSTADVPLSVQHVIDNVTRDVSAIALKFSIGVLVVGAVLLIASFFIPGRESAEKA
jgi:hypothetical protein